MRKKIIAGNWKMNGTRKSVESLLQTIKAEASSISAELVVFPPFVFLEQTQRLLTDSHVLWGGQNLYSEVKGAFTGETSPSMLKDFGCTHVLIGHSERRALFGETDEIVSAKFQTAIHNGLIPIVCIGETLEERKKGLTYAVLRTQLDAILFLSSGFENLRKAVIAYEPVWAIGTGLTAQPETAQEVHAKIRGWITEYDKEVAQHLQILYGGSVKIDNAAELLVMPDIDGALIGGASLHAEEFLDIAKSCSNS